MAEEFDPFAGPAILATAPTTEPQRELWTAVALGDDASLAFNESITLRFRGALDLGALRTAFGDLVARHEALRATVSGDGLTLLVSAPFEPVVGEHDLRGKSEAEQTAALDALRTREVETPFDLAKGPLFRVHLVQAKGDENYAIFTAHHIVNDGWSTAVMVKDWAALYNRRRAGQAPDLAPPESFTAYATAQAARSDEERSGDEAYWLKQFGESVPVLDLPSDRPRPPRKTYASAREDAVLERELIAEVRRTGAKSRASLFATLFTAFKVLVYRLSGQDDLVIGIMAAGQATGGHDSLVGHCVNMVPIRSRLTREKPFNELLGTLRGVLLDAQEHQDFTLGKLLTKLPIARDPSRLPLISVIFNVDRGMTSEMIGFAELDVELRANPRSFENFDLFLNAVEIDGRVILEAQYNTDLFERETIRRWLDAYRTLLADFAKDPAKALGAIDVLSNEERALLESWNRSRADYRNDACLHDLVEDQARKAPSATACEFGGRTLSYSELDGRANALARALRKLGAKRGALVGLCVERTPDLLVGLLGISKAGAAYVPLDPGYPTERLSFMASDSGMSVLVTEAKLRSELALPVEQVLCLDELPEASADSRAPLERTPESADPTSTAYVIYTSGSTGKPKGVRVPHGAVVNIVTSLARRPGLTTNDVVLAITTMSFDIAVTETWLPLSMGAKIALATREIASDGALLRELIERSGVTFIQATPATFRLLLGAGWQGGPGLTLVCGGEAMPKDLARELVPRARAVWNAYGPTETTVWSTVWQVPAGVERILIGRPCDNTELHVLDEARRHVPIGATGELYIGGAGVTEGYHGRPELTEERFVPNPFAPGGGKLYRTGDLVRYLASGELECLGRNDHQVKLRGFRIELGEIEDALHQHPGVKQATVILREDRAGDARLVAYVVHAAAEVASTELRTHLKRTLPEYMIPATYVGLARMPLTPSGKVDRRALPAPDPAAGSPESEFVAPRNETERLLADVWASTLGVGRVSVEDDFFALGGHSLLAAQILGRLRRNHGIELSFRKFFEAPTIARLAALIDAGEIAKVEAARRIQPLAPGAKPPLSISQERLFLLEEMHPTQRLVHNLPAAWEFTGTVELGTLQRSLDFVAKRHEMMRMHVAVDGGRAVQHIDENLPLEIVEVDLRKLKAPEREPEMMRQIRAVTAEPLDLERGPLFRSMLFRLEDNRSLYFTLRHNLIWDGWSFDVFLRDLCVTYSAFEKNETPSLPELTVNYGDYAAWQREWSRGNEMRRQIEWWQQKLGDDPPDLDLPHDHGRPPQPSYRGSNVVMSLSRSDADALTALARSAGTTLFTLLFAGFTALLHRFSGQTEVLVGTPVRGRSLPELEDLVGPFINTVVLRTRPESELSFSDYMASVREVTLDAFSNEDMPLEIMGTRPPAVRAFFSFQDARERPVSLGNASVRQVDVEPPAAANDLMLWMMERPNELVAVANFSTDLFERETIELLLKSFVTLLRDVVANPKTKLGELRILSDDEAGPETSPLPGGSDLGHEVFVQCASQFPTAAACFEGGKPIDYATMERRSRIVAETLAARGVAPGTNVGVFVPASADLLLAVLGAWQAGGTVLALDPEAPRAFNDQLCAGANVSLVVTTAALREKAPNRPISTLEELAVGLNPRSQIAPEKPAWLNARLDVSGNVVVQALSHRELCAAARDLASRLGLAQSDKLAIASPLGSEILPLLLLTSATLGAATTFVSADSGSRDALASANHLSAPLGTCLELLGDQRPEGLGSILVDGPATERGLETLLATGARTHVAAMLGDERGVVFVANAQAPSEPRLLGKPLGLGRAVVRHRDATVPTGAIGRLAISPGTGDLRDTSLSARRRRDGAFQVSARPSGEAVLGGSRIRPDAIARTLESQPAVAAAFVRVESTSRGVPALVAYVVPRQNETFTQTELRRHVRRSLPEVMVPSQFVELDALPLGADGGVQTSTLPSPFAGSDRAEHVAPRTPNEELVARAWRDALGLGSVSVYDNFFDLGGHSLLCFQVIARLEAESGKRLSPRLFLLNTLEQLAAALGDDATAEKAGGPENQTLAGRVLGKLEGLFQRR